MNILQSAFWLLYLFLCSLLLQGRTCTLADFFGHIFISIVLLFVRMPSLAFSSATCQEEWGVVLAIWTRSNLITPSALTQATNLVTFKTKINTTGFRNIWNTLLITDHWSDFLDILSECFLEKEWDYMMFLCSRICLRIVETHCGARWKKAGLGLWESSGHSLRLSFS